MQCKIILCVCTCGRPEMLASCLSALAQLQTVTSWSLEILVIDNNAKPMMGQDHANLARLVPFPIRFVHEPEPGIPFGRNKALQEALTQNADWIGFIDDDEEVDNQWLFEMHKASKTYDTPILHGWTQSRPDDRFQSIFAPPLPSNKRSPGALLKMAGTDNVLFRVSILGHGEDELRFDEQMRYLGGSDIDFFQRAVEQGHQIVWVPQAIARETIPPSRLSLGYQLARSRSVATSHAYISAKRHGALKSLQKESLKATGKLIAGMGGLLISPLFLLKGTKPFGQAVLKAGKKIAYAAGTIGYFFKIRPERYRQIDGS